MGARGNNCLSDAQMSVRLRLAIINFKSLLQFFPSCPPSQLRQPPRQRREGGSVGMSRQLKAGKGDSWRREPSYEDILNNENGKNRGTSVFFRGVKKRAFD